jgi:hypothetical protein
MNDRAIEKRLLSLPLDFLPEVMLLRGVAQAQQWTLNVDAYTSTSTQNSNNGSPLDRRFTYVKLENGQQSDCL